MKKLFTLLFIVLICQSSFPQEYVKLMEKQDANFYDIQASFNNFWDGKTYVKGKGWKQFKRWEYFMEPRVYPTGRLPKPNIAWEQHQLFQKKYTTKKGVNNKSANWTPLGPTNWSSIGWNPGIGRINCVAVDPNNSSIIYVGSPAGGCWKTTDGGASWSPMTDNLASLGVSGIAIDPNNSNIVYIATGDGDGYDTYSIGVLKSIDGGLTWSSTGLNWTTTQARVMRKIIVNPNNSSELIVATSNGLYQTLNGGTSWNPILTGSFRDVEYNPLNPSTIFACTNTLYYKSTNGGNSFINITNGVPASNIVGRLAIGVTPNDTNYVYLLASDGSDASFYGLYRSTNAGNSFSLRTSSPNVFGYNTNGQDNGGQSWYDMAVAVSPTNKNEVYTGGVNVWKSTNGGSTLNCLTQWNWPTSGYGYVHADIHTLDFYGSSLFCGSDGGIFKSTNNGNTWSDLTAGIQNSQFYRIANSVTNANIIMVGAQDNGSSLYKNNTWTHVTGGDGMECVIDYSNANIMYSTSQYGNIYKSIDGGNTFNGITGGITESGAWVTPYQLHPSNSNTIIAGYENVWKSTNGGNTWNTISNFTSGDKIKSLAVAPSNGNQIYVATNNTIYKTTNGGTNWLNISTGLPVSSAAISYITVHNTNPNILWVSFSGYSTGNKVYKSTNGGSSWTNISNNLPNIPVNCITYEYGSNEGLYVGTDVGVYYTDNNLASWQSYMTGLPNVMVYELEIHYGSSKLRAATYGRGVWESDLFTSTPAPPIAQINADKQTICPGECVQFSDASLNNSPQWKWYFQGGTPATSTVQNPQVCYSSLGNYDVSFVTYNAHGQDSLYLPNYITVQAPLGNAIPYAEGFENGTITPNGWSVINNDGDYTWAHTSNLGGFGLSTSCAYLNNYSNNFIGLKDYIVTDAYNLTGSSQPMISFDIAYAPFSSTYSDTLALYYTTDCGVTMTKLWEKDGLTLSTTGSYSTGFFTPTSNQWRTESVTLGALSNNNAVQFMFENRSGYGNAIYLDNINLTQSPLGLEADNVENNFIIFPNPAKNTLFIKSNEQATKIQIFNIHGQEVFNVDSIERNEISLRNLEQGVYFIRYSTKENIYFKKFIKQ